MTGPVAQTIPRRGRGTNSPPELAPVAVADWAKVCAILRRGQVGPFCLSVPADGAVPHERPVFAAWAGSSFLFTETADTRYPHATISVNLDFLHLVVEGRVSRVTETDRLRLTRETIRQVFSWTGDQLDADDGAPCQVYELVPVRAYGFPTRDEVRPTRWIFNG